VKKSSAGFNIRLEYAIHRFNEFGVVDPVAYFVNTCKLYLDATIFCRREQNFTTNFGYVVNIL